MCGKHNLKIHKNEKGTDIDKWLKEINLKPLRTMYTFLKEIGKII